MLESPHIGVSAEQETAVIRLTVPRRGIAKVLGTSLNELREAAAAQGISVIGPAYSHFIHDDPTIDDVEIGVPVAGRIRAAGRVVPALIPSVAVARAIHHGGHDELESAWIEFDDWIHAHGLHPVGDVWEIYTVGPESHADCAEWQTELNCPLTRLKK